MPVQLDINITIRGREPPSPRRLQFHRRKNHYFRNFYSKLSSRAGTTRSVSFNTHLPRRRIAQMPDSSEDTSPPPYSIIMPEDQLVEAHPLPSSLHCGLSPNRARLCDDPAPARTTSATAGCSIDRPAETAPESEPTGSAVPLPNAPHAAFIFLLLLLLGRSMY